MITDDDDGSSCVGSSIPCPFGDGETQQQGTNGGGNERDEGSPDTTITTSSSYVATRHLGMAWSFNNA